MAWVESIMVTEVQDVLALSNTTGVPAVIVVPDKVKQQAVP